MELQIVDNIYTGSFLYFKSADVDTADFGSIQSIKPGTFKQIFCSMVGYKGTFPVRLYKAVAAAIVTARSRDGRCDAPFSQL